MTAEWFDPETLLRVIYDRIIPGDVVLDVGCGIKPQAYFKPRLHICCEPWGEYVRVLQKRRLDSPEITVIQDTAQHAVKAFRDKSVDSIFLLDLIEHLDRPDGERLLAECNRIARRQVVLFTPLGFCPQEYRRGDTDAWGLHGGSWQTHRSGWTPDDFDGSWQILASRDFHTANARGERLAAPLGAFFALKSLETESDREDRISRLPLVSIVTRARNQAPYLEETILSVLGQGYPQIEYIVLDDGSTDNTGEVLAKYAGRIISKGHPDMGESRTPRVGFDMAHGQILAVLNPDASLLPGAVSAAVAFLKSHPAHLAAYSDWFCLGSKSKVVRLRQAREYDYLHLVSHHCSIPGPATFMRRRAVELAGIRDTSFEYVADMEFWWLVGLRGEIARIPGALASSRAPEGSGPLPIRGRAAADEHIRLVRQFFDKPDLPSDLLGVRRQAFSWAHAAAAAVSRPGSARAIGHLWKSALYHPWTMPLRWRQALLATFPVPVTLALEVWWHRVRQAAAKALGRVRRRSW